MAKEKENFNDMDRSELEGKLASLRESLRSLHFKVEGSKSKNVKEVSALKKNIARVLTSLNGKKNKK